MTELLPTQPPCGICVTHALARGIDFSALNGTQLADGTELHPAITVIAGTNVCWYHALPTLTDLGRATLTRTLDDSPAAAGPPANPANKASA
ncbi:hypothetical protein HMPREF0591_4821 [Mycobacterium parascrofulaceum ATCC BAA-614]|uniref:Uncharacterized protein n=1 Tax=Mycobacterium parascrofulaceum ATCC BAA-614 TaxID=525368 RepID=D5PF77_9MYCO|nr:hypothetical protein [Mycobacterium parascrofulaceum]EFG75258.1 hypothetical protein HMPREF0591_4821 [Mycobacterium parascrofulaceum ATCC BAA-614]